MTTDAIELLDRVPVSEELSPEEAEYVAAARAQNTMRGYKSDWREFETWCAEHGHDPVPASPTAISRYLTELARHGAKVGTMSRRLSGIRFGRVRAVQTRLPGVGRAAPSLE